MARVGFLIIATNKYIQFVKPLLDGMKQFVHLDYEPFIFTDSDAAYLDNNILYWEHRPFPYPTLMRYHAFTHNAEFLQHCEYLFYCDADMRFAGDVGEEILGYLVAVQHPGFYNKLRSQFTYETRRISTAYIAPNEGTGYYCGGFQGGRTDQYLKMSEVLSNKVNEDLTKGIIAVWHDESHYNRYLIDNPPSLILSPSYCYPESWNLPFEKKLLALDKNHRDIRS